MDGIIVQEGRVKQRLQRPFGIKLLFLAYVSKAACLLCGFLLLHGFMRDGFIEIEREHDFYLFVSFVACAIVFFLILSIGLLYVRRWARLIVIFLALIGIVFKTAYLSFNYDPLDKISVMAMKSVSVKSRQLPFLQELKIRQRTGNEVLVKDAFQFVKNVKIIRDIEYFIKNWDPEKDPSVKNTSNVKMSRALKPLRRVHRRSEEHPLARYPLKSLFTHIMLIVDFVLLFYLVKSRPVRDAFSISGAVRFKDIFIKI